MDRSEHGVLYYAGEVTLTLVFLPMLAFVIAFLVGVLLHGDYIVAESLTLGLYAAFVLFLVARRSEHGTLYYVGATTLTLLNMALVFVWIGYVTTVLEWDYTVAGLLILAVYAAFPLLLIAGRNKHGVLYYAGWGTMILANMFILMMFIEGFVEYALQQDPVVAMLWTLGTLGAFSLLAVASFVAERKWGKEPARPLVDWLAIQFAVIAVVVGITAGVASVLGAPWWAGALCAAGIAAVLLVLGVRDAETRPHYYGHAGWGEPRARHAGDGEGAPATRERSITWQTARTVARRVWGVFGLVAGLLLGIMLLVGTAEGPDLLFGGLYASPAFSAALFAFIVLLAFELAWIGFRTDGENRDVLTAVIATIPLLALYWQGLAWTLEQFATKDLMPYTETAIVAGVFILYGVIRIPYILGWSYWRQLADALRFMRNVWVLAGVLFAGLVLDQCIWRG